MSNDIIAVLLLIGLVVFGGALIYGLVHIYGDDE